jgi:hemerythrin-like domain-containing protein
MDAIETLMNEHRTIERVLDALEAFADEAARKGSTEKEELARFVTFIRDFADRCHHGKEEDILFQAMIENGFPSNGGPIAVMLHDHAQGRALVQVLRAKAEQEAPWSAEDLRAVAGAAHGFADLLHAHIHKEDAVLYPMAEQHLPAEVMAGVSADCARYEAEKAGTGEHERLHALGEALVARYAPAVHPRSDRHAARGFGCCG